MTIIIFKTRDGRWTYCPDTVRRDPAFSFHGQFLTREQAVSAVKHDSTCKGFPVKVEAAP